MVGKKKLSIFMATAFAVTSLVTAPVAVQAEHLQPDGVSWCNNTFVDCYHTGFAASIPQKQHRLSNGQYCTPTRLVFIHSRKCIACKTIVSRYVYIECEEDHSLCGTRIQGMGHY